MEISVTDTDRRVAEMETRMPFHFGNVTMTEAPQNLVTVTVDIDGSKADGVAMGTMATPWFLKDPELSFSDLVGKNAAVVEAACQIARDVETASSVFELWTDLYERQQEWAEGTEYPPLLWGYGVSLVEQAVIDAFCQIRETTFHDAVHSNAFGIDLGWFYEELDESTPADYLPSSPVSSTAIRHTVGLTDPLRTDDLTEEDHLDDGLPQALEEYVRSQGIAFFKVKLSADLDRDATRLKQIADLLAEIDDREYVYTVDANEQYATAGEFKRQWETLRNDAALDAFTNAVRYVEQPLPRDEAFSDETRRVFGSWDTKPPIIIDESDDRADSLGQALDCGYAGTSHKNCKGVIRGIANACRIAYERDADPSSEYVISGEDLTTLGPVELMQDLAVMGTLGMDHVERNGHHYYRGLSMLPDRLQEATLSAHEDLYTHHDRGYPTLDIRDGTIRFDSVIEAPFGRRVEIDTAEFPTVGEWFASINQRD